jgi:hypothetical protein
MPGSGLPRRLPASAAKSIPSILALLPQELVAAAHEGLQQLSAKIAARQIIA